MTKTRNKMRLLLLGFGISMAGVCQATEDESGARLSWKYHCITCHGKKGVANSDRYPNLAGQNVTYLISRLRYFREGSEPGNQMNGQAKPLTDDEINALAEYFNQPKG